MALILHERGEHRDAGAHLARARELGRVLRSEMLEFMFLLAEARFALDTARDAEGVDALRRAMALGRAQGYLMARWWQPAVMARLCARALAEGIEVAYAARLVTTHRLALDPPPLDLEAWPWPLRVRTLGGLALSRHGRPVVFPGKVQRKPLALLKALVALGGQDVTEEQVADLLWPDAHGDSAHRALGITLHRLRELIGVEDAVRLRDARLSLDRRTVWVDVWAFEHLLGEADRAERRGQVDEAARLRERALGLYRGAFLGADAQEAWALPAHERLRGKFLRCAGWLGRRWAETGRWREAVDCYQGAIEIDDLAEDLYRDLMACYARRGLRAEALAVYRRCRAALEGKLGAAPAPETEDLYRSLTEAPLSR